MTGKELKERYPFLIPRNRWSDDVCGRIDGWSEEEHDNWCELDDMPRGWRMAFGEQMCEEIYQALMNDPRPNALEDYRIIQIKEKFGSLRFYDSHGNREIDRIIEKYEDISAKTCIRCGKPATKISTGWISPYCDDCAQALESENGIHFVPIGSL